MRTPFRVLLVLAASILALPVLAQQGAAGRWNASVDTPQGPFAFSFDFAVDAAGKLTGSMNNELFGATPITNGVVNGNNVSFKLTFAGAPRSEEHTSELQSQSNLVCRLLLEKKKKKKQ